jgi:polar amino acid transport system substrate-binding protein
VRIIVTRIFRGIVACAIIFGAGPVLSKTAYYEFKIKGLVQNSAPKYIMGEKAYHGICGDIYSTLAERLKSKNISLSVENYSVPIKRILGRLQSEANSIFCGAPKNTADQNRFKFSNKALYRVSNVVVTVKSNKARPKSVEELKQANARIGTFFGSGSASFLKTSGVKRLNARFRDAHSGLDAVAKGEIDYFFYNDLSLLYLTSSGHRNLQVLPTRFRSYGHWMLYSPKVTETVKELIDTELQNMSREGDIEKIRHRYNAHN